MGNIKLKFHLSTLVVAILLTMPFAKLSAQVTETKDIKKTFAINKSTVVDIGNKYGDISIETWEKDSVKVEIQLKVTDKNRDKLRAKMNTISFDFTQSGHYIVANTIIAENKSSITKEVKRIAENVGVTDASVQITMSVKVPDKLNLRVTNKFGNVYLDDYNGNATINMAHGKLKAHNLTGITNLKIQSGDAIINSIETGNLEIYYSGFNLSNANKIRITSNTSDISITKVSQLIVNSKRDIFRIRMINNFESDASWTDFAINEFNIKSTIKMNFGDLTIEKIKSTFESIVINARSTKINLYFDRQSDINFDITSNREVTLPVGAKIDTTEKIDEKEKIMRYKGRTGVGIPVGNPKLLLTSSAAEIKIMKE